jgi:[protein-PII] uridylyltransferase
MGFDEPAVELAGMLVRRHLLLAATATTRDPEDPATAAYLAGELGTADALALLLALTEADARATAPQAWSSWRAGLVREVAGRTAALLGEPAPVAEPAIRMRIPREVRRGGVSISTEQTPAGCRVTLLAPDRVGLLADAAAVFALQRVSVRSARAWAQDGVGVSVWEVADDNLDERVLRQRLDAIVAGRVDPAGRLAPEPGQIAPSVVVRPEASARSTVLEVRASDRLGVVHLACAALARLDLTVVSAHVDTLGPQAVDVFYVQETAAGALGDARAAEAAHAVREALTAG